MEMHDNETELTGQADPDGGMHQQLLGEIEKLKEIDVAGIEPMLPPTWKEGRFK